MKYLKNFQVKVQISYSAIKLCYLVNTSFSKGNFSNILKNATVKLIYKKGTKEVIENYGSITLLSTFSKIIQISMFNGLINFKS